MAQMATRESGIKTFSIGNDAGNGSNATLRSGSRSDATKIPCVNKFQRAKTRKLAKSSVGPEKCTQFDGRIRIGHQNNGALTEAAPRSWPTLTSVVDSVNSVEIPNRSSIGFSSSSSSSSSRNIRNVRVNNTGAGVKNSKVANPSAAAAATLNSSHRHSNVVAVVSASLAADSVAAHAGRRINLQRTLKQASTAARSRDTLATSSITATATATPTHKTASTTTTTTTTTRTTATLDYILITDYDQLQPKTFWQKYGGILLIAALITACGAAISILIAVIHCARAAAAATAATRRASVALALPIPLKPEDQTPLHAEPEHPVPMLSVQTASCAGMERLGVPARTTLNTPPDDRGQFSRRMCVDARELHTVIRSNNHGNKINSNNVSGGGGVNNNFHHYHHQQHQRTSTLTVAGGGSGLGATSNSINSGNRICSTPSVTINSGNIVRGHVAATAATTTSRCGKTGGGRGGDSSNSSQSSLSAGSSVDSHSYDHHQHYQHQLQQQQTPRCAHHVPLPDSEWGQDRDLQIRTRYQQSEITRSYIKPPPNKTVKDVPEQSSYNFYALTAPATAATMSLHQQQHHHAGAHHHQHSGSQNQNSPSPSTSLSFTMLGAPTVSSSNQQQQPPHKSKPSVITKLFSRKSSPKSPTALNAATACSVLASSISLSSVPSVAASANALASSASTCSSSSSSSSASSASSVSTSSSASSLSSALSLPISTASALTTTPCSYGPSLATPTSSSNNILAGLGPSTQLLTTIGVSATATAPSPTFMRIPTPPLSVSVPLCYQQQQQQQQSHKHYQQHQQQQQHHQQQQLLIGSMAAESATTTALKSSTCTLATSPLGAATTAASASDVMAMECGQLAVTMQQSQSQPPATSTNRARTPSHLLLAPNDVQSAAIGSNIGRNSSTCNCNAAATTAARAAASTCKHFNNVVVPQQQQTHSSDQQHTL